METFAIFIFGFVVGVLTVTLGIILQVERAREQRLFGKKDE